MQFAEKGGGMKCSVKLHQCTSTELTENHTTNMEKEKNTITDLAWALPLGSLVGSDGAGLIFHASLIST